MFQSFKSQEERREYGGSSFLEFQFCKMPATSKLGFILTIDNIKHWQMDSLYVNEYELFSDIYSHFFDCGFYNNMEKGIVDVYGINYYTSDSIDLIISRIENEKPEDHLILLDWIRQAKKYNGFYILGI